MSVWQTVKLKDVCERVTVGYVGPMAHEYRASGIPFLRFQNITPFRVNFENLKYIDDKFHEKIQKSALRPGDVGVVRTGYPGSKSSARLFPAYSIMMTSRATIGAIGINTMPACTNQGFITCIPNEKYPLTFLYHWLKLNKPTFELLSGGATFAELTIPQLFLTNALCILSKSIETKVGSVTAGWEYFFPWLRVEDEKEKIDKEQIKRKGTSVESAIAGLCAPERLLDYIENFIIYHREVGGVNRGESHDFSYILPHKHIL